MSKTTPEIYNVKVGNLHKKMTIKTIVNGYVDGSQKGPEDRCFWHRFRYALWPFTASFHGSCHVNIACFYYQNIGSNYIRSYTEMSFVAGDKNILLRAVMAN